MINYLCLAVHVSLALGTINLYSREQYILMDGSFGRDITLVCNLDPLVDSITWKSSRFPGELSECDFQTNECDPPFHRDFTFTADYVNQTYRMKIPQMTWEDNANYTCEQGNGDSMTRLFEIDGVLPVNRPMITDNIETRTIEVTTDCIYPDLLVVLKWYILKTDDSRSEYIPNNATYSLNSTGCEGKAKHMHTSFTLAESSSKLGIAVHFYVVVEHLLLNGTTWISANTQHTYYIEDPTSPTSPSTYILVAAVVGISVVAVIVVIMVHYRCSRRPEDIFVETDRKRPTVMEITVSTDNITTSEQMIATNPEEKYTLTFNTIMEPKVKISRFRKITSRFAPNSLASGRFTPKSCFTI